MAASISCHFSLGSTFFLMYTSEWRDRRRRQPHNVFSIQLRQNSKKKPTISGQITLIFVSIESIPAEWFDYFWILALSNLIFGSSQFKRNGLGFFYFLDLKEKSAFVKLQICLDFRFCKVLPFSSKKSVLKVPDILQWFFEGAHIF